MRTNFRLHSNLAILAPASATPIVRAEELPPAVAPPAAPGRTAPIFTTPSDMPGRCHRGCHSRSPSLLPSRRRHRCVAAAANALTT